MPERLRYLPAGSDALLVELEDLETTLTLLDALQAERPERVVELIPAARTLLVRFDARVINGLLCLTPLHASICPQKPSDME
ncbi:carboxyltransferase domain-containing protein [Rhizobium mongolense]|uniref:carboxyltransferase domain-containing protein n=1 Tax=Rhizobium mongolense TaxID=57676 RepID=UPI0034A1D25E